MFECTVSCMSQRLRFCPYQLHFVLDFDAEMSCLASTGIHISKISMCGPGIGFQHMVTQYKRAMCIQVL